MVKFGSLKEALEDYVSDAGFKDVSILHEAILDGHAIPDLGDLSILLMCTGLGYLSLNKCDISQVPAFPEGLKLERLEMCDNKLHDGLERLGVLTSLEELHLGGNAFDTFDKLKPLQKLENLRILDITDCPADQIKDIHDEIFKLLPKLEAFNGKDQTGDSVDFEDESHDFDDYSSGDSDSELDDSDDYDDSDEDSDDEDDDEGYGDVKNGHDEKSSGDERPSKTPRHD